MAWRKAELSGGEFISRHVRPANCGRRPDRRQVLREQSGISPASANVDETKGAGGHHRQAQGGAKNLSATLAMGTIERQEFHAGRQLSLCAISGTTWRYRARQSLG